MIYTVEWIATDGTKHLEQWTQSRIKIAFNFGQGTTKDFLGHVELNSRVMKIISVDN